MRADLEAELEHLRARLEHAERDLDGRAPWPRQSRASRAACSSGVPFGRRMASRRQSNAAVSASTAASRRSLSSWPRTAIASSRPACASKPFLACERLATMAARAAPSAPGQGGDRAPAGCGRVGGKLVGEGAQRHRDQRAPALARRYSMTRSAGSNGLHLGEAEGSRSPRGSGRSRAPRWSGPSACR